MIQTIHYTLSFEDFQRIMDAKQAKRRLNGWKRILVRTLVVLFVMVFVSQSNVAMAAGPLSKSMLLLAANVLFAFVLVLAFDQFIKHILLRLIFRRQKSRIKQVELSFDDDKLNWSASGGAGYLNWSSFEPPVEQPEMLVLFFHAMQAFIVPARAFSSPAEFEETCQFIKAHIKAASAEQ